MLGPNKSRLRRRARTHAKRLRFESLESRCLLTATTLVEQQFRADDFAIGGSYHYDTIIPESNNYHDSIPNGTYSSSSGHIAWTTPRDGTGFIVGQATGSGTTKFDYGGTTWTATNYTLVETGRFDFTIDAALSQLHMVNAQTNTTQYTSYQDLHPLGQNFPQPNPATPHFFAGSAALYSGTFDSAAQKVAISYNQASPPTTAGSPAAALQWSDQTATDMVLTVQTSAPVAVPAGWVTVPPTSQLAPTVDLSQGLDLSVEVHGKPVATADVQQPVATVRLFWAASATDMTGQEILVTPNAGTLGVYWNSARLHAIVTQFPARPADAAFLRVSIDAASGADGVAGNSTQFVAIFQASSDTSGPVSEDSVFDGSATSLLAAADFAEPNVTVQAYTPTSSLGAVVQVVNQRGGYLYDPTGTAQIQAMAQGETADDVVQFLAVKGLSVGSLGVRTIMVTGVNDPPVAGTDSEATGSYQKLVLAADTLLTNDTDVDHSDGITLRSVASTSQQGAAVLAILDDNSTIVQVEYNPTASSVLKALAPGQQLSDVFTYEIVDLQGAQATGHVAITVTGSQLLTISPVPPQCTTSNEPTAAIPITLVDAEGTAVNPQWSVQAADPSLIPNANLQFSGTGLQRQLVITPVPGTLGRTQIQVTVSDDLGRSASVSFPLVIGLPDDLDLDGVPNVVEDAGPNGGDMNGDGAPDRHQSNVATLPAQGSGTFLCLTVPASQAFTNVATLATPEPSGPAANAQFPLGLVHYELLVDSPGAVATVTFRTNLAAPTLNRFYQYDDPAGGGVGWRNFMDNGSAGALVFANRIEVKAHDGGPGDQSSNPDGRIMGVGAPAHVAHPWQNDQPLDANNDGLVSALDVLTLIIQFNLGRSGPLDELPQGTDSLPPFLDTSGDSLFSPLDVLFVINHLNNPAGGEGEAVAPPVAAPVPNTSASLVLATPTLTATVGQDASGLSRSTEHLAVPAVVPPVVVSATVTKRKAVFAADVDAILADVGSLTPM